MKKVGFTAAEVQAAQALVETAGFREVTVETRRLPKERASYLLARCEHREITDP